MEIYIDPETGDTAWGTTLWKAFLEVLPAILDGVGIILLFLTWIAMFVFI